MLWPELGDCNLTGGVKVYRLRVGRIKGGFSRTYQQWRVSSEIQLNNDVLLMLLAFSDRFVIGYSGDLGRSLRMNRSWLKHDFKPTPSPEASVSRED